MEEVKRHIYAEAEIKSLLQNFEIGSSSSIAVFSITSPRLCVAENEAREGKGWSTSRGTNFKNEKRWDPPRLILRFSFLLLGMCLAFFFFF